MLPPNTFARTVIMVPNAGLGHGDEALCRQVITTYFRTLLEAHQKPEAILFYTAGVKLLGPDSPCLTELRELAVLGVPVIACRTCLEYYGLVDQIAAGEVGNMATIVEMQGLAGKVITL